MKQFARLIEGSPLARWGRRFTLQLVVPVALVVIVGIVVYAAPISARLTLAAAIVALLPSWLAGSFYSGSIPRPGVGRPPTTRVWLWLASFAALMAALHLPTMFSGYLRLEEDRACLRAAQVWLARADAGKTPDGWTVTCRFPRPATWPG